MIYLVRHGEVANPQRLRYGRLPGFVLSESGRQQALAAGDHLAGRGLRAPVILHSPLERAVETARLLAARIGTLQPSLAIELRVEPRLVEIGSAYDGLPRRFAPSLYLRRARDQAQRGLAEPVNAAAARVVAALVEAQQSHDGDLIAVGHQLPLRAALATLILGPDALRGPLPPLWLLRRRLAIDPSYACVLALAPDDAGRWRLAHHWRP